MRVIAGSLKGRRLKAGEYRFDRAMTPFEVIEKIARGDVYVVNVTFREGLTIGEMAAIFEAHGLGPAAAFKDAARNGSFVHGIDPDAKDLEGDLFPETYALPRRADAAKLVAQRRTPLVIADTQHAPEWTPAGERWSLAANKPCDPSVPWPSCRFVCVGR